MNNGMELETADETGRLMAELDRTLDLSSVIREIVRRHDILIELESLTGASDMTRKLRTEIELLEQRLRDSRTGADFDPRLLLS